MANHPNRGWRKRLESGADQWLETDEARELAKPGKDATERRAKIRAAYVSGFTAGRASVQRPARAERDLGEDIERLREVLEREHATQQTERMAWAVELFGRRGIEVLAELDRVAGNRHPTKGG